MRKETNAHLSARNKPSLTRIAARKRTKAKYTKQSKETKRLQNAPFDAEERLRKSEKCFAAFMDNLPGYAWLKDLQGRYVYVNRAVRGLSGYQSLGKTDAQIWPADLAAEYRANDQQVIAAKKPLHTLEHFQLEGKHRYMAGSKFPIFDKTGAIVLLGGVGVDITERIEAEEAVRRSEEHLRLVIDTIPTMAWSVRPDGVVDFLNQTWLDYSGLSLEEYVADPTGPIHPEDTPRVIKKWLAQMAIGEGYEDEMRLRRADGEYRWFLVRTEPLRDEQENLVKWYGSSTDIEDRKQAEEKLKHSEVQLAQAQRLAHIGSWDWDLRTNAVTWSDELYHIFGLQPGTINVAGEVNRFIHPDDLDLGWDTVKRAVASKEPYDYYHRILRPDGTERIARSRGSIMSDEQGEPIKVFGATQDVTELKHAEEKLKHSEVQLAQAQRLAHVGSWDWDLRTNKVTWSDELYRIFGIEPGTIMVAGDAMSFIHPDDQDLVWSTVKGAVANKERYSFYYRGLRPDGSERIVYSRGAVLTD